MKWLSRFKKSFRKKDVPEKFPELKGDVIRLKKIILDIVEDSTVHYICRMFLSKEIKKMDDILFKYKDCPETVTYIKKEVSVFLCRLKVLYFFLFLINRSLNSEEAFSEPLEGSLYLEKNFSFNEINDVISICMGDDLDLIEVRNLRKFLSMEDMRLVTFNNHIDVISNILSFNTGHLFWIPFERFLIREIFEKVFLTGDQRRFSVILYSITQVYYDYYLTIDVVADFVPEAVMEIPAVIRIPLLYFLEIVLIALRDFKRENKLIINKEMKNLVFFNIINYAALKTFDLDRDDGSKAEVKENIYHIKFGYKGRRNELIKLSKEYKELLEIVGLDSFLQIDALVSVLKI